MWSEVEHALTGAGSPEAGRNFALVGISAMVAFFYLAYLFKSRRALIPANELWMFAAIGLTALFSFLRQAFWQVYYTANDAGWANVARWAIANQYYASLFTFAMATTYLFHFRPMLHRYHGDLWPVLIVMGLAVLYLAGAVLGDLLLLIA